MLDSIGPIRLFTIGFTQTSAEHFFARLAKAEVKTVIDTRLHRDGQLAGFAKATDLVYFLDRLTGIRYDVEANLAPTAEALKSYRDKRITWEEYAAIYLALLEKRGVSSEFSAKRFNDACLLCSEPGPKRCHRRLAAEYLQKVVTSTGGELKVVHL